MPMSAGVTLVSLIDDNIIGPAENDFY